MSAYLYRHLLASCQTSNSTSMKPVLLSLLLAISLAVTGQEFSIKKVELTNESVILYYDLIDTIKERTYTINVFTSKDSYLAPLQKIKGDAGLEVRPGANKKIVWNSKEELGSTFNGDLEMEVRGRVYIPFVKFDEFQNELIFKRGQSKTITWSGGTRQNILNFNLYRADKYVNVIPNVANSGSYDMIIPSTIKPGKGYYFLVSDSKNKDQVMKTNQFSVRRKIPLALKAVPILLIGATVALLLPKSPKNISNPPDVPGQKN